MENTRPAVPANETRPLLSPQRLFAAALLSPGGNLTLAIVNDADTPWETGVAFRGLKREQTLYRYRITQADRDRTDLTMTYDRELPGSDREFPGWGIIMSFPDTTPPSGLTIYTSYKLSPRDPGVMAE